MSGVGMSCLVSSGMVKQYELLQEAINEKHTDLVLHDHGRRVPIGSFNASGANATFEALLKK